MTRAEITGRIAEAFTNFLVQNLQWKRIAVYKQQRIKNLRTTPICGISDYVVADLVMRGLPGYPDVIIGSVKFQDTDGSVDEKLPYHVEHVIKKCYPYPTVLILVGRYWHTRPRLLQYLKDEIDHKWLLDVIIGFDALSEWTTRFGFRISALPPVKLHGEYASGEPVEGEQPWLL